MEILYLVFTMLFGSLKASEIDCLTMAVYYEAGNQSITGKMAVGNVIKNRLEQKHRPDTYCEVVKQRKQFTFYWDGKPEPMPKNSSTAEQVALWQSLYVSLLVYHDLASDVTNGSDHYHNDKIEKPYWINDMRPTAQIENHSFYSSR